MPIKLISPVFVGPILLIEFNIDAVTYEKEISMATAFGWTYSIDGKAVQIDILDKNKTVMDITCRTENRLDLIHQHLIHK